MAHDLTCQHFQWYEEFNNWVDPQIASNMSTFSTPDLYRARKRGELAVNTEKEFGQLMYSNVLALKS